MLIPRRSVRTSQPQSAAGIDWNNPLTKDLVAAFNFSSFPALIDSVSGRIAENQGVIRASGPSGVGITASTAGIRIPWSLGFTTEDISITVVEYRTAVPSSYWMICDNRESGAGYAYGFVDTIYNPGGTLTVPGWKVTTYCKNEFYQNNVKTSAAIGTGLIPSVGVRFLGRYTDSDPYNNSVIYGLIVHKRNISQREHAALLDNPWQIFEDEEEYRFVSAAGGGSVSLVVADALHGHAADSPSFSMATYLAVAESLHAHAADNLTLSATGAANLVVQESTHAHIADGIALTTNWLLSIAESLHGHTADGLALTSQAYLAVSEALHGHTADNLTLDTSNATFLTVQDAFQSHGADSIGFSLDTWLAIVDAAHAHTADAPTLSTLVALQIAEALHAHYADVAVLSLPGETTLTPEDISAIAAAVLAALNATMIPVDTRKINGAPVIGDGSEADDWRGVGVSP